jgi:transposase
MLTQEQSVEIKVLARQGRGIKAIARELGVSRNTVRTYLRSEGPLPHYRPRAPRPSKVEPFKADLRERIEAAHPHWIPATVLLREIRGRGYEGGISQLKAYLAPFKRRPEEPVVRYETPPGKQMQVDFTTIRRGRDPLKAFVATLGFSRGTSVRFCAREDSEAWLTGLREAFSDFGGVTQEVLFDNAGAIITERDAYGDGLHRWHLALHDLAVE